MIIGVKSHIISHSTHAIFILGQVQTIFLCFVCFIISKYVNYFVHYIFFCILCYLSSLSLHLQHFVTHETKKFQQINFEFMCYVGL